MEKGAAGSPQGPTNPGISRYLASRLPYRQHGSGRGGWNRTRSRLAVTAEANGRCVELSEIVSPSKKGDSWVTNLGHPPYLPPKGMGGPKHGGKAGTSRNR
jgi:hypothetical protein